MNRLATRPRDEKVKEKKGKVCVCVGSLSLLVKDNQVITDGETRLARPQAFGFVMSSGNMDHFLIADRNTPHLTRKWLWDIQSAVKCIVSAQIDTSTPISIY